MACQAEVWSEIRTSPPTLRYGAAAFAVCCAEGEGWWRTAGNAPALACLQGRRITFLPRPHFERGPRHAERGIKKMASRPGAAPGKLSFGNSAARWCATYMLEFTGRARFHPRQGGPGSPPSRSEIKKAWRAHRRATPCHCNKEQTPSQSRLVGSCGHRYFTVDLSVFGAHLPRSP
jgi:hypothetical protein